MEAESLFFGVEREQLEREWSQEAEGKKRRLVGELSSCRVNGLEGRPRHSITAR